MQHSGMSRIPVSLANLCHYRVFWGNGIVNRLSHSDKRLEMRALLRMWSFQVGFFKVDENFLILFMLPMVGGRTISRSFSYKVDFHLCFATLHDFSLCLFPMNMEWSRGRE